jgi:hypothetical protein
MTYEYRQPSRINLVSGFFFLVIVGGVYVAVKFIPVYWQGKQVDRELDELRMRASDFHRLNEPARRQIADDIVDKAVIQIHQLGVEDQAGQPVQVWFSPDYAELHARYQVLVDHPGNLIKPTVMTMDRVVEVSR